MKLSLRGVRRATATALATSVAVAGLLTAGCTPQTSGKVISGTIKGADGRIVDVLIGYDVIDGAGHKIDMGGARVGYSAIQRLNHCVGTAGATAAQVCRFNGQVTQVTGYNWSLALPSNAKTVYIEVYPKAPTPTAWLNNYRGYTGVAAGTTNTSTYALAYRRAIPVNGSVGNVSIVLPKVCGAGGTTASLVGHISGWRAGATGSVNAWSLAPNQPTMGFGLGKVNGSGNYRVDGLQSGQRYGLIASGPGYYRNLVDYRRMTSNDTLIPGRCTLKTFNF
jgi:hypothetical protein